MSEVVIPREHWTAVERSYNPDPYIEAWEGQLRRRIAEEPDPAKRFTQWLAQTRTHGGTSARLFLIEQPYLDWAQTVERILEREEKELREQIAYEITHRDED